MPNKKKNKRKSGNGKSKVKGNQENQDSTGNQDDTQNLTNTSSSTSASISGSDSVPTSTLSTTDQNLHKNNSMSTKASDQDQSNQGAQSLYTDAKSWVDQSPSTSRMSMNLDEGYLTALDTPSDSQSNQKDSNHNHQLEEEQDELSLQALDQHLSSLLSEQDQPSNMNQNLTLIDAMNPNPLGSKLELSSLGLTESYLKNASGLNPSSEVFSPKIPPSSLPEQSDTLDASKEAQVSKPSVDLTSESVKDSVHEEISKDTDGDTPARRTDSVDRHSSHKLDNDHDQQSDRGSDQSTGIESQISSLIDPIRAQPITSPTSINSDLIDSSCQITPTLGNPDGFAAQLDRKELEFKDEPDYKSAEIPAVDQHLFKTDASDLPSDASPLESFKEELKADHDDAHMTVSSIGEGDPDHVDKKPLASDVESNLQYTDEEVPTNAASTDEPSKTTSNSMASSEASSDHMLSLDAIPTTDAVLTSSSGCTNDDTFMTSKSHTRPDSEAAVLSSSVAKSEVVTAQPSIKDNENDSAEVTTPTVALPPVDPIGVATSTQEDISLSKPTDQHMLPSTDREDVMSVKSHQFGSDTGLVKSILADASSQTITPQSAQPAISSFLSSTSGPDSQDPKVAIEEKVMGHHTSSQIELVDNIPKEPQTITAEPTASSTPLATDDTAKAPTTFTAELINPPSPPSTNDRPNEPTTSVISPQLDTAPVDTDASQPVNDTPSKDLPAAFVNRTRSVSKGFFKSLNHRKEGSKTPDKSKTLTPSATIAEEITEEKASIVKSTLMKKRSLSGLKQKAVSTWNGRHSNQLLHLKEPLPDLSKIQDVVNNQTNEAISSPEQVGETQEQTPAQQQPPTQDQGSEVVQETLNEKKGNDECKGEEVITRVVSRNTEVNSNSNSGVGLSPMKLFKRTMLHKRTETQTTLTKTSTQPNPAPSPPSTPKTQPTWRLMNNHFSKASTTTNTNTSTPQELNSGGIGYSPSASQTLKKQPTRTKTLNESSEKKVGSKDHYRFSGFFSKIFR